MARKVFVDVIVRENKAGKKRPMSLIFEDGEWFVEAKKEREEQRCSI